VRINQIEQAQEAVCRQYDVVFVRTPPDEKIAFATSTKGPAPINGLRHPRTEGTSGWFIWCGQSFSDSRDFFQPQHALHLYEQHPEVAHLLGLPPGWRFLLSGDYLDIWYDGTLLKV
jgi:hypothetical protein